MNSLVSHSLTAKTASSANQQEVSAFQVLEMSVKIKQLKLDLERLAEDSMNSPVSHSLTVKMDLSANQQEVSAFQELEIYAKR